jgi:hypothetical protein
VLILGTPDLGYGSTGASVSTVPINYQVSPAIINDPGVETHYIGGRAVAAHLLASETPAMLVAGHDHWIGGNGARRIVSIVLAEVSPDFARQGMPVRALSDASQDTDVLTSSPISSSRWPGAGSVDSHRPAVR